MFRLEMECVLLFSQLPGLLSSSGIENVCVGTSNKKAKNEVKVWIVQEYPYDI